MTARIIHKFGLAVIRNNSLLLCRPFAFPDLILPGGIKEGNEDHVTNLVRETFEELGAEARLVASSLKYLGRFEDAAAGRADTNVVIELWKADLEGTLAASSEIAELVWYDPRRPNHRLSMVVRNKVVPFLVQEGLLTMDAGIEQ